MKNFILPLLFMMLACCGCSKPSTSEVICSMMEKATEKMETATTPRAIQEINDNLSKDIAVFTLSLTQEEYEKWTDDAEGMAAVEKSKEQYINAKQKRENFLKGN